MSELIRWGFGLSVALHLLLSVIFSATWTPRLAPIAPPMVIDVVFETPAKLQMVTPPDAPEADEAPVDARLLSEKNFKTDREQLRRGDGLDAAPVVGPAKAAAAVAPQQQAKAVKKSPAESAPPKQPPLKTLALDSLTTMNQFGTEAAARAAQQRPKSPEEERYIRDVPERPFSRPAGSGAAFLGLTGTNDFIPNLPDGDITLLNAKADRFAVFVRRVASRVFGQLRTAGWEGLRGEEIAALQGYSTVHAILSPSGQLLSVNLEDGSGSGRFDEVVSAAVKRGAGDPNPPQAAAAEDGNYHFIFRAKSWAVRAGGGRNGALVERRWLVLGTGLL